MEHYDVIGTGAGGGTLVRQLAPSGKRILLLERLGAPAHVEALA
jgi:choline dehydrogenase-like flavoprotein